MRSGTGRLPRHGFKSPPRGWIELELLDHQAIQTPIATSSAAKIDRDRMVEWKYTLFSAHFLPPGQSVSTRVRLVAAPIQPGRELVNRFSPVYISAMRNLYSQTRNVEAIRRLFQISDNRTTRNEPQPAITACLHRTTAE